MFWRRLRKTLLWFFLILVLAYGLGRLYYRVTGGFTISNITYALPYDARWDFLPLNAEEDRQFSAILDQPFHYLGKGCQSYVFASDDGKYVIKFFKFQRFRPQGWLSYVSFLPGVNQYRLDKVETKRKKLENVFISWKIAYDDLRPETGVVFVHLNKSNNLNRSIVLYDKMGLRHDVNLDDFEFMVQKKAQMLCLTLEKMIQKGETQQAKDLLDRLLAMIMSEYHRGFADNDHALMQNTGVLQGQPIHIDVGQFVRNDRVKDPQVYNQELFNKTWKFRKWLEKQDLVLANHVESRLKEIIGPEVFASLKPRLNKASMGVLSHQE